MVLFIPLASPPSSTARSTTPPPDEAQAIDPQFIPTTLQSPNPTDGGDFGAAIAGNSSVLVLGAPNETASGLSSAGQAYIEFAATGTMLALTDPDPAVNGSFGYSVALGGGVVAIGAPGMTVDGVAEAGAAYVFSDTGTLLSSYPNPDATPDAFFGSSISLDDGYLAVGAPNERVNAPIAEIAGAVDLFHLGTGGYRELISSLPQSFARFGSSIAGDGDLIAIGAPGQEFAGITDSGEVFLYSAATGDEIAGYSNPVPATDSLFGFSVALNGSVLVSGAPGAVGGGAAYEIDFATYTTTALPDLLGSSGDNFGASVAVDRSTVLVGAPNQTGDVLADSDVGAAYVFSVSSVNLTSELAPPAWPPDGVFGSAVSEAAGEAVVGAPGTNFSGVDSGAAYLFDQIPLTVSSPNGTSGGAFGSSVALGDGETVVGAPYEWADGQVDAGHAYVVPLDSAPGLPIIQLTSPDPTSEGTFGAAVSAGDGVIAVGAPGETAGGSIAAGDVYVYNATTYALAYTLYGDNLTGASFGAALAIAGTTLVVGAPTQDMGPLTSAGAAFLYNLTNGSEIREFDGESADADFGESVAAGPTVVAIGAPDATVGLNNSAGAVSVISLEPVFDGGFHSYLLSNPYPLDGALFGFSLAVGGATLAVGLPGESAGGHGEAGQVDTFSFLTGNLTHVLLSANSVPEGRFGQSVATNGLSIVVGAPGETAVGWPGAGTVYAFDATTGAILDRFYSPNASPSAKFGSSVAADEDRIVVGSPEGDELGPTSGSGAATILLLEATPVVPASDYYAALIGVYDARPDLQAAFPNATTNLTEYADLVNWAGGVVTGAFPDSDAPALAPFGYYYALMLVYDHRASLQVEFPGAFANDSSYQGLLGWANEVVEFEPGDPAYPTLLPFAAYYEELG